LDNKSNIVDCLEKLYSSSPDLCTQFWIEDYPIDERRSVLDSAKYRFPYESRHLIRLLSSLVSDEETAQYAFTYIANLGSFTGAITEQLIEKNSLGQLSLRSNYELVPGTSKENTMTLSRGTSLKIVSYNPLLCQFSFTYSGFDVLLSLLDAFLQSSIINFDESTVANIKDILHFINSILTYSNEQFRDIVIYHLCNFYKKGLPEFTESDIIGIICKVLDSACSMDKPPSDLLQECLKSLRIFLPLNPTAVWSHLKKEPIIPSYNISSFDSKSHAINRYMQQTLLPWERSKGSYETTISFLDLVEKMCMEVLKKKKSTGRLSAIQADVLKSCIIYIHLEIFPSYVSWRYIRAVERYQIGVKVLKIFNLIISDSTLSNWDPESNMYHSSLPSIHKYLVENYLDGSLYQILHLLDNVAIGIDPLFSRYSRHKILEAITMETCIAQSLRFLKHLLEWRLILSKRETMLESKLKIIPKKVVFTQ
jgi:hypothetical protein